jgi:CheY-like chemotaxis protein
MSKIEAGQVTLNENDFDLYRLLDDIENMFCLRATDKGLLLHFERAADLPRYIHTDEGKLRQVLINLLSNAVKFTVQGYVNLQTSVARRATSSLTLDFRVSDTGPGIAPDELESVFQVFVQTASGRQSHQGTGLGLPISREYVQLMGGELSVESRLGQGAVFKFDIQAMQAQAADAQPQQKVRKVIGLEPDQTTYRLLVVDDNADNRELLVKLLEPLGFEVWQASDGQQGLEAWEQWQPDLIWTDIRLPVLGGYELIKRVRATPRGQSTIIIILTACAFEEEQEMILSSGCDDFVCKPFREVEIFDKLAQHLGARYMYEDAALDDSAPPIKGARKPLSATDLAALPAELLADLRQAAQEINLDKVSSLVEQIRQTDETLAQALDELVEDFRFDTLQALVEEMR